MENLLIPNSTQIPNIILDKLIPRIPEAEMRCIYYICRRTFGFGKRNDRISFSQFVDGIKTKDGQVLDYGAGLSRPAVSNALKNLNESNAIKVIKTTQGNYYEINLGMNIEEVVNKVNQLRKLTKIGKGSKPKLVNLVNPQNQGNKEKQSIMRQAHKNFLTFFYETVQRSRGIKIRITPKDAKMIKNVIQLEILSAQQLEQLAVYFLAHPQYKQFDPTPAVFLSGGILNGLMNKMANKEEFWKELDGFTQRFLNRPAEKEGLQDKLKEFKEKFFAQSAIKMGIN